MLNYFTDKGIFKLSHQSTLFVVIIWLRTKLNIQKACHSIPGNNQDVIGIPLKLDLMYLDKLVLFHFELFLSNCQYWPIEVDSRFKITPELI